MTWPAPSLASMIQCFTALSSLSSSSAESARLCLAYGCPAIAACSVWCSCFFSSFSAPPHYDTKLIIQNAPLHLLMWLPSSNTQTNLCSRLPCIFLIPFSSLQRDRSLLPFSSIVLPLFWAKLFNRMDICAEVFPRPLASYWQKYTPCIFVCYSMNSN